MPKDLKELLEISLKKNDNWIDEVTSVAKQYKVLKTKCFDSDGDTTSRSYGLYPITRNIDDTIPTQWINYLPETFNETWLRKTEMTMEENEEVAEKTI